MKIGDKVRFLSETGGGRIAGFKGNIVLVEDEDGFQIPTPINNVVLVGDKENYDSQNIIKRESSNRTENVHSRSNINDFAAEQNYAKDITENVAHNKAEVEERSGGDVLNCYIAFVPKDAKSFTTTAFDVYIVNDSNYFIQYSYCTAEGVNWVLHSADELEPNTKKYIEDFERESLNDYDRISIQLFAYKRSKSFMLKPTVETQFRLDKVKFYKLHTFRENDFFDEAALLLPIVENDKTTRPLVVDAQQLKKEMFSSSSDDSSPKDTYARRYEDGKKGNPFLNKRKNDDIVVVDLHANSLLDTTAGMSSSDILSYQIEKFHEVLDKYKSEKGRRIVFIHGKGEGVLRHAIVHELQYKYKKYQYQDASFLEYGYGATQVTIR